MKRLQQNMQVFIHTISNAFQMMPQMLAFTYRAPVHSYSQSVHTTQNYVFWNYPVHEALNTHPAAFPNYPHPLPSRYDKARSSTGNGVRRSNLNNKNEKEIHIDEENEKVFRQL